MYKLYEAPVPPVKASALPDRITKPLQLPVGIKALEDMADKALAPFKVGHVPLEGLLKTRSKQI
jgi:hypothetical protein